MATAGALLVVMLLAAFASAAAHQQHPNGCAEGAAVVVADPCLRCECVGAGEVQCARVTCLRTDAPPPPHCHTRHRKNACCPEIHCPDSVRSLESVASAPDDGERQDGGGGGGASHGCTEAGVLYSAGSAMPSRRACERCYCLRGVRRCVTPQCLPPPPGCRAEPAPGLCCPKRYRCEHHGERRDCHANGGQVSEGERVPGADACARCYCIRGDVRCHPVSCAPPLLGCRPLVAAQECCPHSYQCPQHTNSSQPHQAAQAALSPTNNEGRAFPESEDAATNTTAVAVSAVNVVINGTTNCTAHLSSAPYIGGTDEVVPGRIITEPDYGGVFAVNVTSSLRANATATTAAGGDDYDYEEATLPPSLPNLKIIPFVAADAVLEEKSVPAAVSAYPSLERDDKYPVYYADKESKYASRREDVAPTDNMFSPPIETEGGFIPKAPGGEYYAGFPATPAPKHHVNPVAGHHVTSAPEHHITAIPKHHITPTPERHITAIPERHISAIPERLITATPEHHIEATPERQITATPEHHITAIPERHISAIPERLITATPEHHIEATPERQITATPEHHISGTPDTHNTTTTGQNITGTPERHILASTERHIPAIPEHHITPTPEQPITATPENEITSVLLDTTEQGDAAPAAATSAPDEEYDEDEDGFSFGSVLKLLLSDAYEQSTTRRSTTALNTIQRMDHLVLGQSHTIATPATTTTATETPFAANHRPHPANSRPFTSTGRPLSSTSRLFTTSSRPFTSTNRPLISFNRPFTTSSRPLITINRPSSATSGPSTLSSRPYSSSSRPPESGVLKLSGCNIYGRMYVVGNLILELSTPCSLCHCTQLGVHCERRTC